MLLSLYTFRKNLRKDLNITVMVMDIVSIVISGTVLVYSSVNLRLILRLYSGNSCIHTFCSAFNGGSATSINPHCHMSVRLMLSFALPAYGSLLCIHLISIIFSTISTKKMEEWALARMQDKMKRLAQENHRFLVSHPTHNPWGEGRELYKHRQTSTHSCSGWRTCSTLP